MMYDGVVEIFLLSGCLMSGINQTACDKSWDTYKNSNQTIQIAERNFNRIYVDPISPEYKLLGGAAYTFYRRRLEMPLYGGFMVSVKDGGEGMFFFRRDLP